MRLKSVFLVMVLFCITSLQLQAQTQDPWQPVRDIIEASEITNLIVGIGTVDGIQFFHSKEAGGELGAFIPVQIASASKWLTAATIMRLVEDEVMSLDDRPQDYIEWWTSDETDVRSQITLAQLLSFTSGFQGEPLCIQDPNADLDECAQMIYNQFHLYEPNTTFFYSSTHMYIAGLMAVNATGESFNDLFRRLIAEPLNMSDDTQFRNPSLTNPFLAGGAVSTGADYALFLEALLSGDILADSRNVMFMDWTPAPIEIAYSPVQSVLEWHYGLGAWRECPGSTTWEEACDDRILVSSGGGLGWFPWIDLDNGYYGLIGRRALPLSAAVADSIILAEQIRPLIIEILNAQAN